MYCIIEDHIYESWVGSNVMYILHLFLWHLEFISIMALLSCHPTETSIHILDWVEEMVWISTWEQTSFVGDSYCSFCVTSLLILLRDKDSRCQMSISIWCLSPDQKFMVSAISKPLCNIKYIISMLVSPILKLH